MIIEIPPEITYKGDGSQRTFSFPFDYLRKAFIYIQVDGVDTTNFIVEGKQVTLGVAPPIDSIIRIYRSTSTNRLVSWADASVLRAKDMTVQQVQELHILEEEDFRFQGIESKVDKSVEVIEGYVDEVKDSTERAESAADSAENCLKELLPLKDRCVTPQMFYKGEVFADGTPNWTNAIQKALDAVRTGDVHTLYFPSGTYVTNALVSGYSSNVYNHNVTIKGDNAYIKLADNTITGDNQRLFTFMAADDADVVFRFEGLTIDMNKTNNATYYDEAHAYLQHCHAISVYGNNTGTVDVFASDLRFYDLVADGISFAGNDTKTHNSINVSNVISDGNGTNLRSCICQTADFKELNIDNCDVARLEIETNAVNNNPKRTVNISNCNIKNGLDLLIKSKAENVVNINNVRVTNRLFLQGGVFNVSNSYFATNRPTRVLLGDFYFDNCTFTTVNDTEWETRDGYSYYMYVTNNYSAGDVIFNNCKLKWSNPNVSYLFASQSYSAFDTIRFADSDIDVTNGIAVRHGKIELYNNKINYLNGVAFVVYASTSNEIKYVKMYNNVTDNPNAYLYQLGTDSKENIIYENNPAWNIGKVFYTTRLDRFTPVNGGTSVSWSIYETTTFTNDAAPTEGVWIKGQLVKNRISDGVVLGWVNLVNSRTGGTWEEIKNSSGDVPTDVQINGTSITVDGVANIPLANSSQAGAIPKLYTDGSFGIGYNDVAGLYITSASVNQINNRNTGNRPITPTVLDYAVKSAMCDGKGAEWTDVEKANARVRMGITSYIGYNIKSAMDEIAEADTCYFLGEQTSVTVVLPNNSDVGACISVCWYNGASPATLSIQGEIIDYDYTPSANTRSEINALYDGVYWSVICDEQALPQA